MRWEVESATTKTYSREELRAFEQELEQYRITKTVAGNLIGVSTTAAAKFAGDISYIDFDQYLIDKRACVRRIGDYAPAICNIPLFEELTEKYDQLRTLKAARSYAKEKQLQELEAMQSA